MQLTDYSEDREDWLLDKIATGRIGDFSVEPGEEQTEE
jgi:hypothetical protein